MSRDRPKTYTKKDVVRRTAEILDCNIKDIENTVDGYFKALIFSLQSSIQTLQFSLSS